MSKTPKNEKGFSVAEVVVVAAVTALIGIACWLVYKTHHTSTSAVTATSSSVGASATAPTKTPSKTSGQPADVYKGWRSFCSSYGGLCLKYPSNWTIKTSSEPVSTTQNTALVSITSPTGKVTVQYQPYCVLLGHPPTGKFTDDILSVTSPANIPDFKIIKSVESSQANAAPPFTDNFYLTSNEEIQTYGLSKGTHYTAQDNESIAGFFTNPKVSTNNPPQCIGVGTLDSSGGNYKNVSSVAAGIAWFSDGEVQTADQILKSVSYSH